MAAGDVGGSEHDWGSPWSGTAREDPSLAASGSDGIMPTAKAKSKAGPASPWLTPAGMARDGQGGLDLGGLRPHEEAAPQETAIAKDAAIAKNLEVYAALQEKFPGPTLLEPQFVECWAKSNVQWHGGQCREMASCLTWATGANARPKRKALCTNCAFQKVEDGSVNVYEIHEYFMSAEDQETAVLHQKILLQQNMEIQEMQLLE